MKFKGKVTSVSQTITGISKAGNQWRKQDIVITEETQYPNSIVASVLKDKYIDRVKIGDTITAHLNTQANEYNGRVYNSVTIWKIDELEEQEQAPATQQKGYSPAPVSQDDDLPF